MQVRPSVHDLHASLSGQIHDAVLHPIVHQLRMANYSWGFFGDPIIDASLRLSSDSEPICDQALIWNTSMHFVVDWLGPQNAGIDESYRDLNTILWN